MPYILVNGIKQYIPRAYSEVNVIGDQAAPFPDFNIGLILGECDEGYPYYYNSSLKQTAEEDKPIFFECGTTKAVHDIFGVNSKVAQAFEEAKKHGLTRCYVGGVNTLTRGKIELFDGAGTPAKAATVYLKKAGALPTYAKVAVEAVDTTRRIKITPVKNAIRLGATAESGVSRIYVRQGGDLIKKGASYTLLDSDAANTTASVTVSDFFQKIASSTDAALTGATFKAGQKIWVVDLSATIDKTFATGKFACLVEYDTQHLETSPYFATNSLLVSWINQNSAYAFATADTTVIVAALSETIIKDAAHGTPGTYTALADGDWSSLFTNLRTYFNAIALASGLSIRQILMVTPSNTSLIRLRNWLNVQRLAGLPCQGIGGTDWGVVATSGTADTNPATGAAALNSQDMTLCGGGNDYEPAYLTKAPAVFGIRIGNAIKHNVTRDRLLYATEEKVWDEENSGEVTTMVRAGVIIALPSRKGIRIVQSLNTLQNNERPWNITDKTTCYPMQRDLADYAAETIRAGLDDDQVGADEVTVHSIGVYARATFERLKSNGFISSYTIVTIDDNDDGNGFDVEWTCKLPGQKDFIKVITNILV